jgi:hypothetical protein
VKAVVSDTFKKGIDREKDEERQDQHCRYLFPVVVGFHGVHFLHRKNKQTQFPIAGPRPGQTATILFLMA